MLQPKTQPKKHTLVTKNEANKLLDRINAAHVPIAVFSRHGNYICTKSTTDRFSELMRGDRQRDLMGVYDHDVMLEWLEDDLAYMGVR